MKELVVPLTKSVLIQLGLKQQHGVHIQEFIEEF